MNIINYQVKKKRSETKRKEGEKKNGRTIRCKIAQSIQLKKDAKLKIRGGGGGRREHKKRTLKDTKGGGRGAGSKDSSLKILGAAFPYQEGEKAASAK